MNNLICQYCNTKFINISSLNNHQKQAKYCLIIQGKIEEEKKEKGDKEFKCHQCKKILSSNQNLKNHIEKCIIVKEETKIRKVIKEKEDLKQFKCEFCEKVLSTKKNLLLHLDICNYKKDKKIEEYKEQLEKQKEEYKEQLKKQEENYKEQIKELQDKLERLLNKVIDRPTTTNNTINNKFELNSFPSQKEIDMKIESQFNDKYILDGMKGVAQFVYDHIVKLEDGSMAYACFDTSRQIFKYKDENGNEIKDPKAVKLRKMIKPGLLRQSQTLLDYFNDECDYLEKRKDVNGKEYNMMNTLREKAFEVGCDILSIEETNKFGTELANLSCV